MNCLMVLALISALTQNQYIIQKENGYCPVEPVVNATWIGLENGYSFNTQSGEPFIPEPLRISDYQDHEYGYYLIQCVGPIQNSWKEQLAKMGIMLYTYFPYYAFVAGMNGQLTTAVRGLDFVRWVGIFQPAYKVHRELLEANGRQTVDLQLFPDADMTAVVRNIKTTGARVLSTSESEIGKLINVECDASEIAGLARIPQVLSICPWSPDIPLNQSSQWVCQKGWAAADTSRPIWRKGIRGLNLKLGYSDTGIRTTHYAFRDPAIAITDSGHFLSHRKIVAYLLLTGAAFGDVGSTYHGTHVGGTVAGDDSIMAGTNANDGIAYQARLFFVDIANASGSLVTPTDLAPLYDMIYNDAIAGPIRQHGASWGRSGSGYIDRDAYSDAWLWKRKDFSDIFAAGNSGPTFRSINHPAYAKNVVAVGGTQNGTLSNAIYANSSRGPCLDGRIKPTVCAPAQNVMSADGAGDTGYKLLTGTSMATPGCNASAGLIRQYLKQGWYPSGFATPLDSFSYISQSLIRAMLIVSADPNVGSYVVPDSNIGFGRLDIDSVLYFAGDTRKLAIWDDTTGLTTGQYVDYQIQVNDTTLPLRACLVWIDTAAAIGSNPNLVNDLHLQMTNVQGTYYRGNQMTGGQSSANPGAWDTRNVEEVIRVNVPRSGIWTIRVNGNNIPYPRASYSLVVTGGMSIYVGIRENYAPAAPHAQTIFSGVYPNLTSGRTLIAYDVAAPAFVSLRVYDVTGRNVATIGQGYKKPGHYEINWNAGNALPAGVYFVRFMAENTQQTKSIIITR